MRHNLGLSKKIYIPIWLDLLLRASRVRARIYEILHSNMVRFIIITFLSEKLGFIVFTFQYG